MTDAAADLAEAVRGQWARILSAVVRYTGSIELAEDAVQEALLRALVARDRQVMVNPAAWVTTVAKRIAVDAVRRDRALRERYPLLVDGPVADARDDESPGGDDRLGMLLVACAPELPPETRLALALRFVLGVPTDAIADALLVEHAAMSARLTRAKRRIDETGVRFAMPDPGDAGPLGDVLGAISVLYTVGHTAPTGSTLRSAGVAETAIELARAVRRAFPEDAETAGLLALLLLTEGRAGSREDRDGALVTLENADRSRWDGRLISEGIALATTALGGGGRFGLQAGIAGLHSSAPTWQSTDWVAISRLYDALVTVWPSPSALVARAVALGCGPSGPEAGLAALDAVPDAGGAVRRELLAARADLLSRAGRPLEARAAYYRAIAAEGNDAVRGFLADRVERLGD